MIPMQDAVASIVLAPISINGTIATVTSVDTFNSGNPASHVTLLFLFGVTGATYDAIKVQESDDNSTWVDITGAALASLTSALVAGKVSAISIPCRGLRKRYFNIVIDPGASATLSACVAILHGVVNSPQNATAAGLAEWVRLAG